MFPPDQPWKPDLRWETPAGKTLRKLIACLPKNRSWQITVFGSAPLQLSLDPDFLSADIDIFSRDNLEEIILRAGLGKGQSPIYIDQCTENVFLASPTWPERAYHLQVELVTLTFPHPIDLLVSKVRRLEAKDLRAFHLVYSLTGHPTESELIGALQRVVDLYRPPFDEEFVEGNPIANTQSLWKELYGREIDVRQEIIRPALVRRRAGYGLSGPSLKEELRELGRP